MASPFVIAIDQGTSNTKVLAVSTSRQVAGRASCPVSVAYPRPGWVELDPLQVWESVQQAVRDVVARMGAAPIAIGVSNQRESILVWERATGRPLGPVIVWQCRRTAAACEHLTQRGLATTIQQATGLQIDPLFSATKLKWLLDEIPRGLSRAQNGEIAAGTLDSWVLWNLTGGAAHATDASNASRTQLVAIEEARFSPSLLKIFGIPAAVLPSLLPSDTLFGHTVAQAGLPAGVPITAMIADSHAALFAQGGHSLPVVKATYGTGSSLLTPMDALKLSARGLSSTIAWQLGPRITYGLEGNIPVSGAVFEWTARLLFGAQEDALARVAALAASVPDAAGVHLVPAFVGLGAPHWDTEARGLMCGLTRGSGPAQVARAALEAVAHQVCDVLEAMEAERDQPFQAVLADGGASRNDTLMQFQADLAARPVWRSRQADLSALGAAYLAGLRVGLWDLPALQDPPPLRDPFVPVLAEGERERLRAGWQEALRRVASRSA